MLFGPLRDRWQCSLSLPNPELLKPASSLDLLKISRLPEDFTTLVVSHFCSMEFGGYGVGAKIINNDLADVVTYRLHSNRGTPRIVPINSEIEINEWFDIIILTPNAVSGAGQLELDIVPFNEALKNGK